LLLKEKMKKNKRPFVSIVMGSQSDYSTMKYAEDILKALKNVLMWHKN